MDNDDHKEFGVPLTPTDLGFVLLTMAKKINDRLRSYPNHEGSSVLYPLQFALEAGAEECLRIAKRNSEQVNGGTDG